MSRTSRKRARSATYRTAYGDNIHIMGITLSKNIGGVSVGRGVLVSAEHAAAERPGAGAAGAAREPARARSRPTTSAEPTARRARWATPTTASSTGSWTMSKTPLFDSASFAAELTWMHWAKVTQNDAVFKGRDSYTAIDKRRRATSSASRSTSRRPGSRSCPGVDLLAPISTRAASTATPPCSSAATRTAATTRVGVAADIYSKYRFDLKYTGYFGNYSTNPATGAANVVQRRQRLAVRPRLVVAHVQDHVLRRIHDHVPQNHDSRWR